MSKFNTQLFVKKVADFWELLTNAFLFFSVKIRLKVENTQSDRTKRPPHNFVICGKLFCP
jgi:hypothetical protein